MKSSNDVLPEWLRKQTMEEKKQRTLVGKVVSISGDMSIRVSLDYKIQHPKYGKYLKRSTKVAVHDPKNESRVGDLVEIQECRPFSKTKSWRLIKIMQKAG
jgi:small subunit ribosomal protein S17